MCAPYAPAALHPVSGPQMVRMAIALVPAGHEQAPVAGFPTRQPPLP
jgi:hypothetical protein